MQRYFVLMASDTGSPSIVGQHKTQELAERQVDEVRSMFTGCGYEIERLRDAYTNATRFMNMERGGHRVALSVCRLEFD